MNADHVINDIFIDDTSNEILLTLNYLCYVLLKLLKGFQHNLLIHTQPIISCCCVWGIVSTTRPANNTWHEIMSVSQNHSMCFLSFSFLFFWSFKIVHIHPQKHTRKNDYRLQESCIHNSGLRSFPPCDGNYHAVGLNGDRLYSVLKLLVNNFVFLPCNQCVYRMTDKHLLVFSDVSAK